MASAIAFALTSGRPGTVKPAGAQFGAYVEPAMYTDEERMAALERFEASLGRQLDIVHSFHPFEHPFPSAFDRFVIARESTLLLSWAGTNTDEIVAGLHDDLIETRARAIRDLEVPVLLRWRWEMNRPNLRQEIATPASYVRAWRHIRSIFADVGANNVQWVWCPLGHNFTATSAPDYYPGDDEVDWLCVDAYSARATEPLEMHLTEFLDWAKRRPLPIMLGEFSTTRVPGGGDLATWLQQTRRLVKSQEQIAAVVFFEADNGESGPHAFSPDEEALAELVRWGADPWFRPTWRP